MLFCGRDLNFFFFSPLKGTALGSGVNETNLKDQLPVKYFLTYLFPVQYPKRYRESSCWKPFETQHPKSYQNRFFFLTPKSTKSTPVFFIWERPPAPHGLRPIWVIGVDLEAV